jgi:hypothetical protein
MGCCPGLKFDDAYPAIGKANMPGRMHPDSFAIRPAMALEIIHHAKCATQTRDLLGIKTQNACNTTHGLKY